MDDREGLLDDGDPGLQLFHRLRRLSMELELSRAEFAGQHGLHPTDLRALVHLLDAARAGERATPGWLGRQLGLNSAGITALADRLERLGQIRRVRDTRDRRRVFLEVTPEAIELGWAFFGPQIGGMVQAMRSFSEAELAVTARFLDAMTAVAAAGRAAPPAGQ